MPRHGFIFAVSFTLLTACGGGGGGGSSVNNPPNNTEPDWVAGVFEPAAQFENLCANPRSGTDPSTNRLFEDRQGTAAPAQGPAAPRSDEAQELCLNPARSPDRITRIERTQGLVSPAQNK